MPVTIEIPDHVSEADAIAIIEAYEAAKASTEALVEQQTPDVPYEPDEQEAEAPYEPPYSAPTGDGPVTSNTFTVAPQEGGRFGRAPFLGYHDAVERCLTKQMENDGDGRKRAVRLDPDDVIQVIKQAQVLLLQHMDEAWRDPANRNYTDSLSFEAEVGYVGWTIENPPHPVDAFWEHDHGRARSVIADVRDFTGVMLTKAQVRTAFTTMCELDPTVNMSEYQAGTCGKQTRWTWTLLGMCRVFQDATGKPHRDADTLQGHLDSINAINSDESDGE